MGMSKRISANCAADRHVDEGKGGRLVECLFADGRDTAGYDDRRQNTPAEGVGADRGEAAWQVDRGLVRVRVAARARFIGSRFGFGLLTLNLTLTLKP